MSTFKIIKKGANNFWHRFNNDAKKVAISDFEVVLDEVSQTFVIVYKNGANVPNQSVNVLNIEVIDETDTSNIETFTNVVDLRSRLVQLGYTPYLSGIGIQSVVAGTNISVDNTDPANPIISSTGGDLQEVTDEGNTTTNPILIPELQLYDAANDAYAKINYFDGQYNFLDVNNRVIKVIEKDGLEQTLNLNDFTLTKEISSLTANRTRIEPNKDGTYAMLDDILPSAWKEPAELLLLNADVVHSGGLPQISGLTIQGHTLVQGSRVVVTEYNVPAFNGIYRVGSGPIIGTGNYLLVRTNDANSTTELNNAVIGITNGTFGGKTYRQTTANPVINTTTINFVEFAPTITIDANPTDGSSNAVSSNGVFDALALKEDTSNKVTTFTGNETSTTKFPVVKAIIDYFTSSRLATILGFTPANDASVVHIAGTETITGAKTFSVDTVINGHNVGRGGGNIDTNVSIGTATLAINTIGNQNTGVGYTSLRLNVGGSFNVGLGYASLRNNGAGNNNVGLGYNAGRNIADGATSATTINNSIFLGFNTKPLADNQTNQIVIGYNSTGLGSNTTVLGNSSTTLTAIYGSTIFGGTSVNVSAILQADSTTKGFLPPRMTNAQRIAIVSPAIGLMVYCTDTVAGLYVYKSTGWTFII